MFYEEDNSMKEIKIYTQNASFQKMQVLKTNRNKRYKFNEACLREAVRRARGKDLLFSTCLNPIDFYENVNIPEEIDSTFFVAMTCSDEEVAKRLKARPAERMCGDDEFIKEQIDYLNWYRKNKGKFQLYIDNTDMTVSDTANKIADFIRVRI